MRRNLEETEMINYILIGICIGVGLGYMLKTIVDTYLFLETLPL